MIDFSNFELSGAKDTVVVLIGSTFRAKIKILIINSYRVIDQFVQHRKIRRIFLFRCTSIDVHHRTIHRIATKSERSL